MSEFDNNPFADPFAEPSIQQATQPSSNITSNLADYDPFSPTANSTTIPYSNGQPQQPALVTPTNISSTSPPAYTQTPQQQVNSEEFQRRQDELERKAQELARREEELKAAVAAGGIGARQNNWPPLWSGSPIGPCFYQDINVDIPLEFQKMVRMLYYLWMFYVLMLLLNVLGGLAIYISLGTGTTFGLAILYLILFSPLSYICWFRPIYKAFRSDSSFNFMVFFFIFFFQLLINIAQAVGIPSIGACGWIGVGKAFNEGAYGAGVFLVLLAICSTIIAMAMALLLIWVHRIYRSTGASFMKAQAEFASGVMKNEHVQQVASNAASAAVRNQFGAQSPGAGSTSTASSAPRF